MMTLDTPMIWTAKGNQPLDLLGPPEIIWERTPTYTKIRIIHRLGGELVREEAHVMVHEPLSLEAIAGSIN